MAIVQATPKVSVIIPVYNVEQYLRQCLDSILTQTLYEIEIIALNDGSTDNSYNILIEYTKLDKRLKVLSHPNRGLGPTRNRGIEEASGEYLAFIDSDDFISSDALRILYERAKQDNADIVVGEVIMCDDIGNYKKTRKSLFNIDSIVIKEQNIEYFYREYYFTRLYSDSAWDKLYRRDFVVNNHLLFGDNKRIFAEDNWFQLQVFQTMPKISFVATPCFYYRQREGSIMHQPHKDLAKRHGCMVEDYLVIIKKNGNRIADRKVSSLIAFNVLIMEALNHITNASTYKSFIRDAKKISLHSRLRTQIRDVVRLRSYQLESNSSRRFFLRLTGSLYCMKMYRLAHSITWFVYKMKNPNGIRVI